MAKDKKKKKKSGKPPPRGGSQLKGKKGKGALGQAETAGDVTNWSDLEGFGVLVVGAYASDKAIDTKYGRVENPIHADVVVFDTETLVPVEAYPDNNFFEGALSKKVLYDALDDGGNPSGSCGVVAKLDIGNNQSTFVLDEAPKALRKAIEAFYRGPSVVSGPHGLGVMPKTVKEINSNSWAF